MIVPPARLSTVAREAVLAFALIARPLMPFSRIVPELVTVTTSPLIAEPMPLLKSAVASIVPALLTLTVGAVMADPLPMMMPVPLVTVAVPPAAMATPFALDA